MTTLYPDVIVEFSPSTDPLDTPVWVDISTYLRSFSYSRGRSRAVNRAEAGTATIVLDNLGGTFDPGNTAGPFYPGVRPMRRIRITALLGDDFDSFTVGDSFLGGEEVLGSGTTLIPMFSGFVETWRQDWNPSPSPNPDATVTVSAVDAFKVFALMPNLTGGPTSYTGVVLDLALDDIGWPTEERRIDQGRFIATPPVATRTESRLGMFQGLDETEGGLFFIGGDGYVVFTDADHVFRDPPSSDEVWGDVFGERDYGDITISYDESVLWNSITVSAPGLYDLTVQDSLSQERYLLRDQSLSTLHAQEVDLQTRAFEYIARFSEPHREITELEVGRRDDIDWKTLLGYELQDRVFVRRRPVGEAMIEQDSIIEGISVDSPSRNQTVVKWRLSALYGINHLSEVQSSFEDGATVWGVASNCSFTIGTSALVGDSDSVHGIHHLLLTATAAGDMYAETSPTTQPSMAVVVGETYTASAYFQRQFGGAGVEKLGHVEIVWRNSSGTLVSSTVGASVLSIPEPLPYVQIHATGVAPASAAFATVRVVVEAAVTGASGVFKVDAASFQPGDSAAWSIGRGDLV